MTGGVNGDGAGEPRASLFPCDFTAGECVWLNVCGFVMLSCATAPELQARVWGSRNYLDMDF